MRWLLLYLCWTLSFSGTADADELTISATNANNSIATGFNLECESIYDVTGFLNGSTNTLYWYLNETLAAGLTVRKKKGFCTAVYETEKTWNISLSGEANTSTAFHPKFILYSLSANKSGTSFTLETSSGSSVLFTLDVKDCPYQAANSVGQNITYRSKKGDAIYNSEATCSCIVGEKYFANGTEHNGLAVCSATAVWSGCDDAQCWFAPEGVEVEAKTDFYENDKLNLSCQISRAFPNVTQYNFTIGNENPSSHDTSDFIGRELLAVDNNKTFCCQAISDYVIMVDQSAGFSKPKVLVVYFGPKGETQQKEYIRPNETKPFSVLIEANPAKDGVNAAIFNSTGGNMTEEMSQSLSITNATVYQYKYVLNRTLISETEFTFQANTFDPPRSLKIQISITGTPTTEPSGGNGPEKNFIIPVVVSVAVVCVILIIILVFMIRRRRINKESNATSGGVGQVSVSQSGSERQERENPLYGTAGHFEKEERANPLYGTAGAAAVEEATYSEVKKPKNKAKKNGKENPGYSNDNMGDTYAEVKKPKKNMPAQAEPEVTYAALNKKKKKGSDQNVLHGSPGAQS